MGRKARDTKTYTVTTGGVFRRVADVYQPGDPIDLKEDEAAGLKLYGLVAENEPDQEQNES